MKRSFNMMGFCSCEGKKEALTRKQFERTARYRRMSRDLSLEKGVSMILVIYPHGIYVGPDQLDKGREAWRSERGEVYAVTLAFDLVAEFVRKEDIAFEHPAGIFVDLSRSISLIMTAI